MAESDWSDLANSLSTGNVERGVTQAITPPNGGGVFVFGWNSLNATPGAVGFHNNQSGFAPFSSGGSISGTLQVGGNDQDASPMLFMSAASADVNSVAYILGLTEDEDNRHIILVKQAIDAGLVSSDPVLLRISAKTVPKDVWVHVRLDVIAQPSGDVLIQVFENDLLVNEVGTPIFVPIDGMADFVDDALQIFTGSPPLVGGFAGAAYRTKNVARHAFVDHIVVATQT